jgi:hypothetical protein
MRKRIAIKVKVDIKEIGMELQAKSQEIKERNQRRRRVFSELCEDIRSANGISIEEAKTMLKRELNWKCIKHFSNAIV